MDFINVHPEVIYFTVKNTDAEKAVKILENMEIKPEILPDCAKVAAVGAGMTGVPGVMAKIVDALAEENVQILQSADSYTTIWVLVKKEDMKKASGPAPRFDPAGKTGPVGDLLYYLFKESPF